MPRNEMSFSSHQFSWVNSPLVSGRVSLGLVHQCCRDAKQVYGTVLCDHILHLCPGGSNHDRQFFLFFFFSSGKRNIEGCSTTTIIVVGIIVMIIIIIIIIIVCSSSVCVYSIVIIFVGIINIISSSTIIVDIIIMINITIFPQTKKKRNSVQTLFTFHFTDWSSNLHLSKSKKSFIFQSSVQQWQQNPCCNSMKSCLLNDKTLKFNGIQWLIKQISQKNPWYSNRRYKSSW